MLRLWMIHPKGNIYNVRGLLLDGYTKKICLGNKNKNILNLTRRGEPASCGDFLIT